MSRSSENPLRAAAEEEAVRGAVPAGEPAPLRAAADPVPRPRAPVSELRVVGGGIADHAPDLHAARDAQRPDLVALVRPLREEGAVEERPPRVLPRVAGDVPGRAHEAGLDDRGREGENEGDEGQDHVTKPILSYIAARVGAAVSRAFSAPSPSSRRSSPSSARNSS